MKSDVRAAAPQLMKLLARVLVVRPPALLPCVVCSVLHVGTCDVG